MGGWVGVERWGTILIKQALLSFSDGTGPVNRKFCDTRCKRERVKVDV